MVGKKIGSIKMVPKNLPNDFQTKFLSEMSKGSVIIFHSMVPSARKFLLIIYDYIQHLLTKIVVPSKLFLLIDYPLLLLIIILK